MSESNNKRKAVEKGVGFGTCLAIVISYTTYQSIGWAIIHGLLSWLYVIYYLIKYADGIF